MSCADLVDEQQCADFIVGFGSLAARCASAAYFWHEPERSIFQRPPDRP